MKFKKYILFIFIFVVCSVFGQAPELTATVSKNKLGVNQRLRIEFSINKQGGDNFKVPTFKNFNVIGGPSQSVSQSWINGKSSFKQSYTYIIQPKQKGELTIASASIVIDGKTIQSKPLKITVTDAVKIPKNPNDPNYIAEQNIHLVSSISKTNPYVGESVYVEYRLYFKKIGIDDLGISELPKFNGFWNQEIDVKNRIIKTDTYNGEQYRYLVLKKALLIPTKSGKLYIEPMEMEVLAAVPTGRGDFFGNMLTRKVKKDVSSPRKLITVKALPTEGKPDSFTGAVGEFTYKVNLSKQTLKANESSQIKVAISGKGNLKLVELPTIQMPSELEVYQPERQEKTGVTSSGIRGEISNTYTIVPEYKGKYKIPSTEFSYFNPKNEKYHVIKSEDTFVDVLEGKELPSATNDEQNVNKQTVKTTGKDFRYIQTYSNFTATEKHDFFNSAIYYLLLLLPLLAIPIGILIRNKQLEKAGDVKGNKLRNADRLAKKYLSEAQKNIGNKEDFYESLERALHNYLKAKLGVETSDISREKITTLLENKEVNTTTITHFIDVFKNCDFARYTPITDVQMQSEYQQAKEILTELDKQL